MGKQAKENITFPCGKTMKNRFMLAPLTNQQSHENGQLSDQEFKWLTMRAKGGFGLVMTCAAHVQEQGKGFPGQLGIFSDALAEGHIRLAKEIKAYGSLAVVQLHHAGMRSPKELIGGVPVCPSDNEKTSARALTLVEIKQLRDDFIKAAIRAKKWGYDGVEVHGAHGYILSQFLSSEINFRKDEYGGDLTNRSRLLFEIVSGIRKSCGNQFLIGVRLSPERFGMKLNEIKTICQQLVESSKIDFLDLSLWDVFKLPVEEKHQEKPLLDHFLALDRKNVALTVAGNILTGSDVKAVLAKGVDFVTIGRGAILHHDFPLQMIKNDEFQSIARPVSRAYLEKEGLSSIFIDYMRKWKDFVKE